MMEDSNSRSSIFHLRFFSLMAGKAGRMARVMDHLVDEIHIERARSVRQGEKEALIERENIESEEAEKNQRAEDPFVASYPS